ncbi:diguanylate cyclase [Guyparkeria sp. 1SP6A2]|nr:diguanylate cyclase [Guyparkeria sp. 1SP6A2]
MHSNGLIRRRTATWPPYRAWVLLGAIWLVVVAGLGYANVLVIDRYAASSNQQIEQRTRLLAQMQMTLVDNQLDAIDRGLQVFRQRHVDRPIAGLGPALDFNPLVRDVWWVGPQGERVFSRHGTVDGVDPEQQGFFRHHRSPSTADSAFLSPLLHPNGEDPGGLLAMSRAHRTSDGRLLGVLVAWIDPAGLARVLDNMTVNDRLTSLVARRNGEVLVMAPHVPVNPGTTLEYLQSNAEALPPRGSGRYRSAIDGKPYQYAYAALENWDLLVFAAEDRTAIDKMLADEARDHWWRMAAIALFTGLLLVLVGWLLQRRATALRQVEESQRQLAQSYRRNAAIIEALPDLLFTMDANGRILDFEPGENIPLLKPPEAFIGQLVDTVLPPDLAELTHAVIQRTLMLRQVQTYQYHLEFDGERRFFEGRCAPLSEESVLILIIDITGRKRAENAMEWAATHDNLTQLPNRRLFRDRLDKAITDFQRYGGAGFCLLFIDLNGFKAINDRLGHAAGDALLQQAARRMEQHVRAADSIARLSGDEFVVMITHAARPEALVVSDKLAEELAEPFVLPEGEARISAAIGLACCPEDGRDAESLMRAADAAMYRDKQTCSTQRC